MSAGNHVHPPTRSQPLVHGAVCFLVLDSVGGHSTFFSVPRTTLSLIWNIGMGNSLTPLKYDSISKAEIWVSFSEVPCGAVLSGHNRPQIWQQPRFFLSENTEEHPPIKAQEEFGQSRNARECIKKPNLTLHKGSKDVWEPNDGYKGTNRSQSFLFMGYKKRGWPHPANGFWLSHNIGMLCLWRRQKTQELVNPNLEPTVEMVLCWHFYPL